jgi:glycosyltransferase involved in cell wall biosynthesis
MMHKRFQDELPKVSIITPSYQQGAFIEKTILSVLAQDYPHIEYIVLDSCSNDETSAILAQYRDQIDRVIIEKDDGQADAIDKGFRLATGQILAYLNSDDVYASPQAVSRIVETFLENPLVDVVMGQRVIINEFGHYLSRYPAIDFDTILLRDFCFVYQECTFWTAEIYQRAGGFVDKSYRFAMDYELWMRFLAAKAHFIAIPEDIGLFRWQENQKTQTTWRKIGKKEVLQIYQAHGITPIEKAVLDTRFLEFHYYDRLAYDAHENSRNRKFYFRDLWDELDVFKTAVLADLPLDQWMLNPQNPLQKQA